jgi:Tryptophan-associated transmembrane protein (Trp_oprn_chp)
VTPRDVSPRRSLTVTLAVLVVGSLLLLAGDVASVGWVALAGMAAVIATTGLLRRLVGGVLALLGLAAATTQGWNLLSVAGGLCVLGAGVAVVVLAPRWRGLSRKYDRTAGSAVAATASPTELWQAMDQGHDLTAGTDSPEEAGGSTDRGSG